MPEYDTKTHTKRRICFWRIELIDTRTEPQTHHDPFEVFRVLEQLQWADEPSEQSRFLFSTPGSANVLVDVTIDKSGVIRFVFGRTNRADLPDLQEVDRITALQLAEKQGLLLFSHGTIYPGGVLAWERVNGGPTPEGLKKFIKERSNRLVDIVVLKRVPTARFIRMIPHITEVRLFDMVVSRPNRAFVYGLDQSGITGAVKALSEMAEWDEYSIRGKIKDKKKKGPILTEFWRAIQAHLIDGSLKRELERLRVGVRFGEDAKTTIFDLLEAHLCIEAIVKRKRERSANADSTDMFKAIDAAHDSLKTEIDEGWELDTDDDQGSVQQELPEV